MKLRIEVANEKITTIVPLHKELSPGTLEGVLELAKIDKKEFWEMVKK